MIDIFGWLWWCVSSALGILGALGWFLISGWVSTLMQITLLVTVVYFVKYGWQRAPVEIWRRTRSFGRFFLGWVGARESFHVEQANAPTTVRVIRAKEFGDINISTLLSLAMLVGLLLVSQLQGLAR